MRRLTFTAAVTILAVLAACSSGSEGLSDEEQEYADAFAESIEDDEDGFGASSADAECMAEGVMAELGTEPFEEADVSPDDIGGEDSNSPGELLGDGTVSDDQADAIMVSWDDCTNVWAALAESAAGEFDLDDEAEECVADGLDEDDLGRDLLRASFTDADDTPDDDILADFLTLLEECGGTEGGGGGAIVDGIAEGLAAGSNLTDEQAQCLAQALVDDVGLDRLIELGAGEGGFDSVSPAAQQEIAEAVIAAAGDCEVPISELGG